MKKLDKKITFKFIGSLAILYLVIFYNQSMTNITRQITAPHNYTQWFYNHFMLIKSYINYYNDSYIAEDSVIEVSINEIKFYIPKKYIQQINQDVNKYITSIHLALKYPEMTPLIKNDNSADYNIRIIIASTKNSELCKNTNICKQMSQEIYEDWTNIVKVKINKIEKLYRLLEANLTAYKINDIEEYLLRGHPLKPEYWFNCNGEKYSKKFIPDVQNYY